MSTPLSIQIGAENFEDKKTLELLRWATDRYQDKLALSCSFGAEDIVLVDLLSQIDPTPRIFTLDTGRLPSETYDLMAEIEKRYRLKVEVYFPDRDKVEEMVNKRGINLFRDSIENRKLCCHIRKVDPLHRALKGLSAWVTGLRREQSVGRSNLRVVEQSSNGLVKINPLATWSHEDIWHYIRSKGLSYNKLHDLGYTSIGCAPCTSPVKPGEHERAGRWAWEQSNKECGLHSLDV